MSKSRHRHAITLVLVGSALAASAIASTQGSEESPAWTPDPSALRSVTLPVRTPVPDPVLDTFATASPGRARIELAQPKAALDPIIIPTPTPAQNRSHTLRGLASWYCNRDSSRGVISACHYKYPDRIGSAQMYAAAGPRLRAALGKDWRNSVVYVNGVRVKLVDWCQCYKGQRNEKIIDLYRDAWDRVPGVTKRITITW